MRATTRRFRSAALIAMLVGVMTAALAGTASAAPQARITPKELQGCGDSPYYPNPIFIQSMENGLYVAAELNYTGGDYGMLRARTANPYTWEQFCLYFLGNDTNGYGLWAFKSAVSGYYVSAELNYGGGDYAMLRARASVPGNWESFYIFLDPNVPGTCDIQNADNKKYVSEEQEYSGADQYMLRARASNPSYYERFKIYANIGCG
jgi:hypothetical protein